MSAVDEIVILFQCQVPTKGTEEVENNHGSDVQRWIYGSCWIQGFVGFKDLERIRRIVGGLLWNMVGNDAIFSRFDSRDI